MPKIVIIGAGSASFGSVTIATLLRSKRLRGSQLGLVDLDSAALSRMERVAHKMNEGWDANFTIVASTDRLDLLPDADFVVVSIEVPPREKLWRMDWEIPVRHGLRQPYGENGGPGGMMHTFRQLPPLLEIVRDMENLCPRAWLINFSNPLPRLVQAVTKYSSIKTVGKCHQLTVGYAIVAALLGREYGLDLPSDVSLHSDNANVAKIRQLGNFGRAHFSIQAAGLNHFTWMLDVRDRHTGKDLYPALRRAAQMAPSTLEPLSMELFRIFDCCPVPGDTHLVEYLPWGHDATSRPWETYNLRLYDWGSNEAHRDFSNHLLEQMARGTMSVDGLRDSESEGAVELIEAITHNDNFYDEAVNVTNGGAIANLPFHTAVELPAVVNARGVQPVQVGPLPAPIAELCRREAALVDLVVDAGVTGDVSLALQALLLDPMVNDIGRARAVLNDYLVAFEEYLPQFDGKTGVTTDISESAPPGRPTATPRDN